MQVHIHVLKLDSQWRTRATMGSFFTPVSSKEHCQIVHSGGVTSK